MPILRISDNHLLLAANITSKMTASKIMINRHKNSLLLPASCWYLLASTSSPLPSLNFCFALFIVCAAMFKLTPCSYIKLDVFMAILLMSAISFSITLSSYDSSDKSFYRIISWLSMRSSLPGPLL